MAYEKFCGGSYDMTSMFSAERSVTGYILVNIFLKGLCRETVVLREVDGCIQTLFMCSGRNITNKFPMQAFQRYSLGCKFSCSQTVRAMLTLGLPIWIRLYGLLRKFGP